MDAAQQKKRVFVVTRSDAVLCLRSNTGTKVVEVRATDADDPTTANGELRYSLIQDQSAFEIDSITGLCFVFREFSTCSCKLAGVWVSTHLEDNPLSSACPTLSPSLPGVISCKINTLDRETKSQYVVVVKAQDLRGMASGSTATTSVSITITDTNDNIASFIRSRKHMWKCPIHKETEVVWVWVFFKNTFFLCRVVRTASSREPQSEREDRCPTAGGQRSATKQRAHFHHPKWHQQSVWHWAQPEQRRQPHAEKGRPCVMITDGTGPPRLP